MKKIVLLVFSVVLTVSNVFAKGSGIEDVKKGDFNFGLQVGIPPVSDFDGGLDAKQSMPFVSLDASWVIASGLFNTKRFGQNGAIDLGLYYGLCHYYNDDVANAEVSLWQHCILFRSGFHFQFLPKLDTYAGAFLGANVWPFSVENKEAASSNDTKACLGLYTGAKYYFTECFGLKLELGHDFNEDNYPILSGGVAFRF